MISSHAIINLEVFEGATFYQEFTWTVGTPPVAVDLTDVTALLHARDLIEDEDPVLELSTENDGIVMLTPLEDGKYAISITPSLTAGLCTTHEKRVLVYDLFFIHGTDDDNGLQQKGKITINPSVTRVEVAP
jgi:hypothetical protein